MSLRYRYMHTPVARPLPHLGGRLVRSRPIIPFAVIGPGGVMALDGLLDTGADDVVLPDHLAPHLGVDLHNASTGTSSTVVGGGQVVRFAAVALRIWNPHERREWQAWVAFASVYARRYALLGFTGFQEFFTATFSGDQEEVELTVNGNYPGT